MFQKMLPLSLRDVRIRFEEIKFRLDRPEKSSIIVGKPDARHSAVRLILYRERAAGMKYDVVALGELLIDFTPSGTNGAGMALFARNPGGAPANVLAMAAKLGKRTALIAKVGDDDFGSFLIDSVRGAGIDARGVVKTREAPTTLAFVQLRENGERSFSFYRKPGADICLRAEEAEPELLAGCGIFHFGSVSLTAEPGRSATLEAAKAAKAAGAVISFDPNYRPPLWERETDAKKEILTALKLADLIKVSGEEMTLLTGETEPAAGAGALAAYGAAAVVVTLGPEGAYYYTESAKGTVPVRSVPAADTTGCGDAFWGALLSRLSGRTLAGIHTMTGEEWRSAVAFANAAGALTATKKGAIPAMPELRDIEAFLTAV
jgi:fructokinase